MVSACGWQVCKPLPAFTAAMPIPWVQRGLAGAMMRPAPAICLTSARMRSRWPPGNLCRWESARPIALRLLTCSGWPGRAPLEAAFAVPFFDSDFEALTAVFDMDESLLTSPRGCCAAVFEPIGCLGLQGSIA